MKYTRSLSVSIVQMKWKSSNSQARTHARIRPQSLLNVNVRMKKENKQTNGHIRIMITFRVLFLHIYIHTHAHTKKISVRCCYRFQTQCYEKRFDSVWILATIAYLRNEHGVRIEQNENYCPFWFMYSTWNSINSCAIGYLAKKFSGETDFFSFFVQVLHDLVCGVLVRASCVDTIVSVCRMI